MNQSIKTIPGTPGRYEPSPPRLVFADLGEFRQMPPPHSLTYRPANAPRGVRHHGRDAAGLPLPDSELVGIPMGLYSVPVQSFRLRDDGTVEVPITELGEHALDVVITGVHSWRG